MTKITMCLMTCGELTESACLEALKPFRDKIILQEVRDTFPQIKALNQMIEQCQTEYLIPLDADIVLYSDALDRIQNAIDKFEHDPNWHTILYKLYDTLTEKEILALKVLRTKIMKQHPFRESATPDVEHYQRLKNAGYTCIDRLLVKNPIGNHIVKGPHFCYHKYRDVYQTLRVHGWEWDSAVFMGGKTLMERAKKHYDFFIKKYLLTQKAPKYPILRSNTDYEDYLWCIAGMMDGILSPIENKSKNLEKGTYNIDKDKAIDSFFNWYLKEEERLIPFF